MKFDDANYFGDWNCIAVNPKIPNELLMSDEHVVTS